MSRLTLDGTVEPVSRDQILRHARGKGNIFFPVQLTTMRIGSLTRLIHTLLYVMTIHTYIVLLYNESSTVQDTKYLCIFMLSSAHQEAAWDGTEENTDPIQSNLMKIWHNGMIKLAAYLWR